MKNNLFPAMLFIVLTAVSVPLYAQSPAAGDAKSVLKYFITKSGTTLMDGPDEFRFMGLAASNLHQNEDQVRQDVSNRFPDEFESRDALTTFKQMGGRATRIFTFTIRQQGTNLPYYIDSLGGYNPDAFKSLDKTIQLCNELGIRLIIPIIDSHDFYGVGGIKQFAGFRGKSASEFWTDRQVISDFKQMVTDILNHKNVYTGVAYKDEKAILAWQLGNELETFIWDYKRNPDEWFPILLTWQKEISAFLRTAAPNHLIMDGGAGRGEDVAQDPNIDIISKHYYVHWSGEKDVYKFNKADKAMTNRYNKVLIADEFGLGPTSSLTALMDEIIANGTSGGLLWGIRAHRRDGGFYDHEEGGGYRSYHWPGFPSGHFQDETTVLNLLREYAFKIRKMKPEPITVPLPPTLLPIVSGRISWQGSTGASQYEIQRRPSGTTMWKTLAARVTDDRQPPLYTDTTAFIGTSFDYRVIAKNSAGSSLPSNIITAKE